MGGGYARKGTLVGAARRRCWAICIGFLVLEVGGIAFGRLVPPRHPSSVRKSGGVAKHRAGVLWGGGKLFACLSSSCPSLVPDSFVLGYSPLQVGAWRSWPANVIMGPPASRSGPISADEGLVMRYGLRAPDRGRPDDFASSASFTCSFGGGRGRSKGSVRRRFVDARDGNHRWASGGRPHHGVQPDAGARRRCSGRSKPQESGLRVRGHRQTRGVHAGVARVGSSRFLRGKTKK